MSFQAEEVYVVPSTVNEKECSQLNIVKFQKKKKPGSGIKMRLASETPSKWREKGF